MKKRSEARECSGLLDDLGGCFSEMDQHLALWPGYNTALKQAVAAAKTALMVGYKSSCSKAFQIVASTVVEMYWVSISGYGRILACDALIRLNTLARATCDSMAIDSIRLRDIERQDRIDRGVATPSPRLSASLVLNLAT